VQICLSPWKLDETMIDVLWFFEPNFPSPELHFWMIPGKHAILGFLRGILLDVVWTCWDRSMGALLLEFLLLCCSPGSLTGLILEDWKMEYGLQFSSNSWID
jgi:hypothetical protein